MNEQDKVDAARETSVTDAAVPETGAATPTDEVPPGVKEVLAKERQARREAEKALKQVQARLSEIEDADKTETQRLTESVTTLTARAEEAERRAARLSVATRKGLPAELAERLVGATEEEMEADADRLRLLLVPQVPVMDGGVRADPNSQRRDVNSLMRDALNR